MILAVAGAIGGTAGDLFHVFSRTDGYPADGPAPLIPGLGVPLWVPLLFASAGVAIGLSHPWFDGLTGAQSAPRPGLSSPTRIQVGLVFLLFTWAASGYLPLATGGPRDAALAFLALTAWLLWDRTGTGVALGLITGALGTLAEIAQVRAGTFYYTPANSNLFGVPSWLPLLYFVASVTVGNLGRALAGGLIRPLKSPARAAAPGP